MQFFGFRDLRSSTATEAQPWAWVPTPVQRQNVVNAVKAARQGAITKHGWLIYSPVRGLVSTAYIEQSNPPAGVRGMVLDYDVPMVAEHLEKVLAKLDESLVPQYVEVTLSGNFRLVWVFERDVPVVDAAHLEMIWRCLADRIKPYDLHPGLDGASFKPFQRWTTGREWFSVGGPAALPAAVLNEVLWETGKRYKQDTKGDIPLPAVAAEIEKRWPGAWQGEFAVGVRGRRFWDPKADNPMGCMVKPDGLVCFTGTKALMTWEELLGADWCRKIREDRLADATANIHFDGRLYWHLLGEGQWQHRSREDTLLELQDRGFDNRVGKGQSISMCGRLLNMIQTANRVDAAVSLVNYHPGVVTIRSKKYLNTTRIHALKPSELPSTPEDFPWLWDFLQGHFARPEHRPLDHFLAWLQRAYRSLLERRRDMGQALFICGPKHNGKTLLSLRIIAPLLGDHTGDPYAFLTGKTDFNAELYDSFLWTLNDAESPRENERGSVLSKIKDTVVNPSHSYHRKFGDRTQIEWVGRLVATLNDDPASVGLLPEVNSNTADKLCYFASKDYGREFPANHIIEATLTKELPRFAAWLLQWQPPKDVLEASRVGVKSYFDPHILEVGRRQGYAYNFRELLQSWVRASWAPDDVEMVASPTDLMSRMTSCDPISQLAGEWKVPQAAKALTTLARDPSSGVVYNDGAERTFTITRKVLE